MCTDDGFQHFWIASCCDIKLWAFACSIEISHYIIIQGLSITLAKGTKAVILILENTYQSAVILKNHTGIHLWAMTTEDKKVEKI